ncbi:MAG: restriction endonuclease subunit S [Eubacteriales bacterium]
MMELARYDAYKDSGVKWVSETPFQWEITRNKEIFEERGNLSNSGAETLLTVSHITGVTRRSEKNVNMFMAETMEGYKLCKKGDLIINTMWAWMGALGTTNENGICSPAYGVYKPRKHQPYNHHYFDYLYRTPNSITEMTRNSKGIVSSRLRLYPKDFFQIKTALPNYETQKAIADYLDTKTNQIDQKIGLLTQKKTQYSKLKESLINETVTRGLDKTVAMKDSGVEWIGEVPVHWEVKRLKELGFLYSGLSGKKGDDFTDEHKFSSNFIPFVNIANNQYISTTDMKKVIVYPNEKQNKAKKNDLFFLMSSENHEDIGKSALLKVDIVNTYLNSFCKGFRFTRKDIVANFINYLLASVKCRNSVSVEGKGFTRINLKIEKINDLLLIVPPLPEQQAIADYLDTKTAHIDRIIETINTQITKLQELRKTLINDVVTGKIKVVMKGEADE